MDAVKINAPVEKSPLDTRQYRALTLPNCLDVLLVNDNASDRAGASLDVSVGSFTDPTEIPGLAHFLEHMLFLGTERFPDEDSYNNFLAENGGSSNAYTDVENTNYHFEIVTSDKSTIEEGNEPTQMNGDMETKGNNQKPKFREALDRFSQFFIAPLFTESATEREMNAVHSEHQKNLQNDFRRMYEVKKAESNPEHPLYKFGCGSKETLGEIPAKNGIDTRTALLNFHETYYSANLMKLCIVSPYSLDLMQEWAVELFSPIRNTDKPNPANAYVDKYYLLQEHEGLFIQIETVKDIRQLEMTWMLPTFKNNYHANPLGYIATLLADEGIGSVLSLLKKLGWADSLSVGHSNKETYSEFELVTTLTPEGVDNVDELVSFIFQYLRIVREKGVQEWFYKEEKVLSENHFRFLERSSALNFARSMAKSMHQYPPEEYFSGSHLYKEFCPDVIHKALDLLTPENAVVLLGGKFVCGKTDKTEKWFSTRYKVDPLDAARVEKWKNDPIHEELNVPPPNPFIPTEFNLLEEPVKDKKDDLDGPTMIFSNEFIEVYHKVDRTFHRPKASIYVLFETPQAILTPWHAVMCNLCVLLLEDSLSEYAYPADRAGYSYRVDKQTIGLRLMVEGYSHRIEVLMNAIVKKLATLQVNEIRFNVQVDRLAREYANLDKGQPYARAAYNTAYLLELPKWHVQEFKACLADGSVTHEAFNQYVKDVQKTMFIKSLVHGNIGKDDGIKMMQSLHEIIQYKRLPETQRLAKRVVKVPTGKNVFVRMANPNDDDNNSAVEVHFQIEPRGNFDIDAKLLLLTEILNKPAFNELRTKQQLGYMVFEGFRYVGHVAGLYVIVQSTIADPDDLVKRIDQFLAETRKGILGEMTDEKFQEYVTSAIAYIAEPDPTLFQRSWRFWSEIRDGALCFDRDQQDIAAVKKLSKEDVMQFFDNYITADGSNMKRVISQVYGNEHPIENKKVLTNNGIEVKNVSAFKRGNSLFPSPGIHNVEKEGDFCPF